MRKRFNTFYSTSDTEVIIQLIAKSKRSTTVEKITDAIFQIQGGYALVMLAQNKLIGVRDPLGIRPLIIGKLKNSYVLASETCALDIIGAKFLREVENGEIVLIENNKLKSIKPYPAKKVRPCVFEYIYFSRPDSLIGGKGFMLSNLSFSIKTISPFSTSLINFAPIISSAHVSDANTKLFFNFPITNGLIPYGSLTPIRVLCVITTNA